MAQKGLAGGAHVINAHLVEALEEEADLNGVFQALDERHGDAAVDLQPDALLIGAYRRRGFGGQAAVLGPQIKAQIGQRFLHPPDQVTVRLGPGFLSPGEAAGRPGRDLDGPAPGMGPGQGRSGRPSKHEGGQHQDGNGNAPRDIPVVAYTAIRKRNFPCGVESAKHGFLLRLVVRVRSFQILII